jgi:hypothetical protein
MMRFRRVAAVSSLSASVQVRRRFQVHVRGPANAVVWRLLRRFPQLVPLAKRLEPRRSRSVGAES